MFIIPAVHVLVFVRIAKNERRTFLRQCCTILRQAQMVEIEKYAIVDTLFVRILVNYIISRIARGRGVLIHHRVTLNLRVTPV